VAAHGGGGGVGSTEGNARGCWARGRWEEQHLMTGLSIGQSTDLEARVLFRPAFCAPLARSREGQPLAARSVMAERCYYGSCGLRETERKLRLALASVDDGDAFWRRSPSWRLRGGLQPHPRSRLKTLGPLGQLRVIGKDCHCTYITSYLLCALLC
jgi:hypothetical protein